jgi:hypothetical protein
VSSCLLGGPLPRASQRRVVVVTPGAELPYDESEWHDAIVVLERGDIELACTEGRPLGISPGLSCSRRAERDDSNAKTGSAVRLRPPPGVWSYSSPLVSPRDRGQWDRSDFERMRDAAMTMGNRS